jgi:hypothetical protein
MFKFSENETVETLDAVPENLRGVYAEGEGGFAIAENLKGLAAAFDGVNNVNQKIRKDLKTANTGKIDLSAYAEHGTTVDEIVESFQNKVSELSEVIDSKKSLVNPEKIREQMSKGFEATKAEYQGKLDAYKGQLHSTLVTKEAIEAIAAEKGDGKLLMPFIASQVRMLEEDGKLFARVVDEHGEVVHGQMGSPMTIREKVAEMKLDKGFGKLFESSQVQGGGTPGGRKAAVANQGAVPIHERSAVSNIGAGLAKMGHNK